MINIILALISSFFILISYAYAEGAQESPAPTNQEVLNNWQDKSGQQGTLSDKNGGTIEWHGQATEDVYNVETEFGNKNNALSGRHEGTFSTTRLKGDLRDTEQGGDIDYIQGGLTVSDDRAVESLYRAQVNNVQLGRAGAGYLISAGDIVANFSNIGSNLGLRGIYGTKQFNSLTMTGYAGTVAESWEALINRTTLTNQPPRSRYLRDAVGFMADYKLNDNWSLFGTSQTYSDRNTSLNSVQQSAIVSQNGVTGTTGIKYKNNQAAFSAEVGASRQAYDASGAVSKNDGAVLIDGSYAWQTVSLQAGYHNIGIFYTSLAQNVVPGGREGYVSGNWLITPSLGYGIDIRRTDTRNANLFGDISPLSRTHSLTNRFTYNATQIPGLNFSLQDMRNWGEVDANRSRNSSTQFGTNYSNQHYSSGLTLTNAHQKTNTNPLSDSVTDGIQLAFGRQVLEGEFLALPSVSGGIQLSCGYQQQRITNGTKTSSTSEGVSINSRSKDLGQLQASITNTDTSQPNGGHSLNTKTVNLEWSKVVIKTLSLKAYIMNAYRNHGDTLQMVDEKVAGVQADYQW
jgi:hypothetical protein